MAADHSAAISSYLSESAPQLHHVHSPHTPSGHQLDGSGLGGPPRRPQPQHAVDNTHQGGMSAPTPNDVPPHALVVHQQMHDPHVNAYAAANAANAHLQHHHHQAALGRCSQGTPQSIASHHSTPPGSASHIKTESLGWSGQVGPQTAGATSAPDEEEERHNQYDAAAAVAAAVAVQRESVESVHHMAPQGDPSGGYPQGMMDGSGVPDAAQQAAAQAAATLYGHVSLHHGGAAAAHYLSQAAMSAASRGQLTAAYSHPVGGALGGGEMRGGYGISHDLMSPQKAVAFLAGPRERIHVFGNPVECCPRCQQEGFGNVHWRPHRHIGELKIRYICERNFEELESNHHLDIPLCPVCGQVLYLYEFNGMLGVSSARRLHKYVLKCASQHVLPIIDLFCQTKRGGERCNSNFKLQWSYGTMVKRCESQKNRDHDLWWVRYKNEWKQRRTIIRYKKDFLRHLSDVQRALLLGLGLEGEAPPDPKTALGPTYDALVASAGGSPTGPKIRKRHIERGGVLGGHDDMDFGDGVQVKRQHREQQMDMSNQASAAAYLGGHGGLSPGGSGAAGVQNNTSAATLAYQTLLTMGGMHGGATDPSGHLSAIQMSYAKQFSPHSMQGDAHGGGDLVGRHQYPVDT